MILGFNDFLLMGRARPCQQQDHYRRKPDRPWVMFAHREHSLDTVGSGEILRLGYTPVIRTLVWGTRRRQSLLTAISFRYDPHHWIAGRNFRRWGHCSFLETGRMKGPGLFLSLSSNGPVVMLDRWAPFNKRSRVNTAVRERIMSLPTVHDPARLCRESRMVRKWACKAARQEFDPCRNDM